MKSKLVALSAISASFVAISLTLGAYVEFVDLVAVVLSSAFVILPLYYKSYLASVLTYLAGGVLAFLISGFNIMSVVFPAYFAFFGLYPIISNIMKDKGLNRVLRHAIGLVWCVGACYGIYFYYTLVMGISLTDLPQWLLWIKDYILYAVAIVGALFYALFDRFVVVTRFAADRYLKRIIK